MKCRYLQILLILLYCLNGQGQNHVVDSLKNVLKTQNEDTNKVKTLNALSAKLEDIAKYDSALALANSAQALAERLGYKKGIVRAYSSIGSVYTDQNDYPKALEYYAKELKMAEELGDKRGQASATGNIGNLYVYQGDYPKALEYYFKVLKVAEELGDKPLEANATGNIGTVYIDQGDYPKALEYDLKALKMAEEMGDKQGQEISTGNIGSVYIDQGDYPKALEYDLKALKIAEELGDKQGQASNTGNIGIVYKAQRDYPKALEYDLMALKIAEELGDKQGQATNTGNIGNIYAEQEDYPKALEYDLKALKMAEESEYKELQASKSVNIGVVYTKQKNYGQAKIVFDSALILSKNIGAKGIIKDAYGGLAALDSATGNYKGEIEDYKLHILYRDSLINEANTKKSVQEQMNFEFEQKQAAEKAEQAQKDIQVLADKRKQRIITWSVAGGLLLVLVFAGFIFRSLRITRKQKQIIEIKNIETEKQKALIEQQKVLVEEKNKDILDSINYAKRLQDAILPPLSLIKQYLPESFLLYKPKDIVAGDFYWMERAGDTILIAAADCTGHGVPGALVSVVCSNALNRTVKEFKITETGKILDKVRELVLETFEKSGEIQDGMDISLASLCPSEGGIKVSWAGAFNSLWYVHNNELKEIAADKQPIGKTDNPKPFTTHTINIPKGSPSGSGGAVLYLFTDGYADQFGGPKGKKFKYKQFQEKLLTISHKPLAEQKELLNQTFEDWRGNLEQVDDVLVIGIRI